MMGGGGGGGLFINGMSPCIAEVMGSNPVGAVRFFRCLKSETVA